MHKRLHLPQAALLLALAALACSMQGCFQCKQAAAILNPDGSGKITLETDVAVPASAGGEKPTALSTGQLFAANLINSTRGADAWSDLSITETDDHKARVVITAYFADINKLKFDMPIEFVWKRDFDTASFTIQRTRSPVQAFAGKLTDEQLAALVKQAQDRYKQSQAAMNVQMGAVTLNLSFTLPGEITETHLLKAEDKTVSFSVDGKKAAKALDDFMASDQALSATFQAGADLPANDDIMLQSMYGEKGPVKAVARVPYDAKPVFVYKEEMVAAQVRQADMLKEAGVELIPKFTVRPVASQPATQGK